MPFGRFGGRGFGRPKRCIRQLVLIAVLKQKSHSSQPKEDQFTAESVIQNTGNTRL